MLIRSSLVSAISVLGLGGTSSVLVVSGSNSIGLDARDASLAVGSVSVSCIKSSGSDTNFS